MAFGNPYKTLPLFLRGPAWTVMPLSVETPKPTSGVMNLFTQGPEALSATLFIGKEIDSSGEFSLYLQSPWAIGDPWPTAAGTAAIHPLSVSGTLWYTEDVSVPFFVTTPSISSGIESIGLYASGDPGFSSDEISTTISGGYPASGLGEMTLFLPIEATGVSAVSLYIDKGFGAIAPLTITSQFASGVVPVSVSGAYIYNSGATLFTHSPTAQPLITFTRGFKDC